ncbi:MAG: ATP-binding protein [Polyangiaceae bacterium]
MEPARRARKSIATRVLASFLITLLAFAITVGWSGFAQRRAAQDSEELARGYVPVALKIGQLRATQATLSTLVDEIPDERNPLSTRLFVETLASVRHARFAEARMVFADLRRVSSGETSVALQESLLADLDAAEAAYSDDKSVFERLFIAIDADDKDTINRTIIEVGAIEHNTDRVLHVLADRVAASMDKISEDAKEREFRAIWALALLSTLTLAVGVVVSIQARRLLAPLARVTERARAVARGDLTARVVEATDDEIGELADAFERMVAAVADAQRQALSNERFAAIGKMAAHVTHEIRNPLSSIGLNVEMLEEELARAQEDGESTPAAEARTLLASIAREVGRLELLSEEYLRLARLPSPRMEADDVAAAVREVTNFARPELERAKCTLSVDAPEKLPPALFDEAQIRQALLNLLRNAREAMPDGGAIEVKVAAPGMSVEVTVDDRGSGVPEEIRNKVFDPFFSTKGEGTGLGLAITRQIVSAHGGTLTCESREGGGTRFRVALPIAPARASAPLPPKKRAPKSAPI